MARPLRVEYPGAVYHITSRGNRRARVFINERDRKVFLDILDKANRRYETRCHAYCLMDNHYHLVLETIRANLSEAMRLINGVYTQTFNRLYQKAGHVFQGRYKAILIQRDAHLLEASRYVVVNPVRAGIVNKAENWGWSSYRATAGLVKAERCLTTSWILSQFDDNPVAAMTKYREFVSEAPRGRFYEAVDSGIAFGSREFALFCSLQANGSVNIKEVSREQRHAGRPELSSIMGESGNRVKNILKAVEVYGYTQKAVADELGVHYSAVSKLLSREMSRFKT